MANNVDITIRYRSVDRCSKSGKFKTLKGAQRFAKKWVGATPEIGIGYAVSGDGVGRITVEGCGISDLFPPQTESNGEYEGWDLGDD